MTQKYDDVLLPFLSLMRRELHANSRKGDRPGWLRMDPNAALLEVFWHAAKLSAAVKNNDGPAIQEHSADVANMAMMVLDVCGGLAWVEVDEPVAWVNGDDLDNMLENRTATIAGVRDGWRKTPLYRHPAGVKPCGHCDAPPGTAHSSSYPDAAQQRIKVALSKPGRERLREFYEIGPVQRAAVESFADALGVKPSVITDAMVEAGARVMCGPDAMTPDNIQWGRECARRVLEAALGVQAGSPAAQQGGNSDE